MVLVAQEYSMADVTIYSIPSERSLWSRPGGIVRIEKQIYGRCPLCGSFGKSRERRFGGNDTCEKGCVYPSKTAIQ